jgi:hypothetical protein
VQAQPAHRIGDGLAGGLAIDAVKVPGREIGNRRKPLDIEVGVEVLGDMLADAGGAAP